MLRRKPKKSRFDLRYPEERVVEAIRNTQKAHAAWARMLEEGGHSPAEIGEARSKYEAAKRTEQKAQKMLKG